MSPAAKDTGRGLATAAMTPGRVARRPPVCERGRGHKSGMQVFVCVVVLCCVFNKRRRRPCIPAAHLVHGFLGELVVDVDDFAPVGAKFGQVNQLASRILGAAQGYPKRLLASIVSVRKSGLKGGKVPLICLRFDRFCPRDLYLTDPRDLYLTVRSGDFASCAVSHHASEQAWISSKHPHTQRQKHRDRRNMHASTPR